MPTKNQAQLRVSFCQPSSVIAGKPASSIAFRIGRLVMRPKNRTSAKAR